MNQVINIAAATIREHSRRKLIIAFVLITLAITTVQIAVVLRADRAGAVAAAFSSLVSAGLFGRLAFVAALAVSMGNIGRPFSDGEAALVLARPVARWQYALGRLGASAGLIAALCLVMAVETQAVRLASGEEMRLEIWGHWGVQAYNLTILAALTTLISVFAASPVLAAILAFVLDRFTSGVELFFRLSQMSGAEGGIASAIRVAWLLTPKTLISPLPGLRSQPATGGSGPAPSLPWAGNSAVLVVWSLAYLALLVCLTIVAVRRKEVRG